METIGQKLGASRRESGLSIEDVAHDTHIHSNMIRLIEKDDFSMFPSVAYAKSFIRKYADFLEVDITSSMEALNSGVTIRLGENELMDEMKKTIQKDRRFRLERKPKSVRRKLEKPGRAPLLLNLILAVLIAVLAIFYFLGFDTSSPEEAREEIARGLQKANLFGEPTRDLAREEEKQVAQQVRASEIAVRGDEEKGAPVARPKPTLQPVELDPTTDSLASTNSDGEGAGALGNRTEKGSEGVAIQKPSVTWSVDETKPAPLARTGASQAESLKVRETPGLELDSNFRPAPISTSELPAIREAREEPRPQLRPRGTNPDANPVADDEDGEKIIRAIPVARSR